MPTLEHPRERRITEAWLEGSEGPRKNFRFVRDGDYLYMDYCGTHRTSKMVAVKFPRKKPEKIFFNAEVWDSGDKKVTTRAIAVYETINQFCADKKCGIYQVPFSITDAAGFHLKHSDVTDINGDNILLEDKDKKLLIGPDEFRYFGALVSNKCKSVSEAFIFLRPSEVKIAEEQGSKIKRQGNWFFIERSCLEDMLKGRWVQKQLYPTRSKFRGYNLPKEPDGNVHIATEGCMFNGKIYVKGTVRHHRPGKFQNIYEDMGTGKHSMLQLGAVCMAVKNNSLGNYSQKGFWGRL